LIEIAPFDYDNRTFGVFLSGPLNVAFKVAIEAGLQRDSITGKAQSQMGLQKSGEMQWLEAAEQMEISLLSAGGFREDL
jgi:hypothetical protein